MLKFSICILVLITNFLVARAQTVPDYSETANPAARDFKVEKKSQKSNKEADSSHNFTPPNKVSIPVTVTDEKGNFIDDLKEADFKIFVDDAEIKISSFQTMDNQPLNYIFLIDMSTSSGLRLGEIKGVIQRLIGNFRAEDKISIITFDDKTKNLNAATTDRTIIAKALNKLKADFNSGTGLYDAVTDIFNRGLPDGEKSVLVLITDGVDTVSKKSGYVKSLDTARRFAVPVMVFYLDTLADNLGDSKGPPRIRGIGGFGNINPAMISGGKYSDEQVKNDYAIGRNYLGELTGISGGSTISARNYAVLTADEIRALANLLRPQYYLAFDPNNAKPEGLIKIRINRPRLKIKSRSRF